ncbi:hypothetical protein HZB02_06070 [Candidatus Woesearchaeota archaeon]|nr:hypothetical protein [Candidatus Woesearchaeota archaeon]
MTNAYNLQQFIGVVESWGLTDVMLPFLLVFVILFAILQKTKILGDDKKNMNVVLALVVSLLVIIPHVTGNYPAGWDVVQIMNTAIPPVLLVAVAIVFMLILIGLLGGERQWIGGSLSGIIAIAAFVVVLIIFGSAAGWWQGWQWLTDLFGTDAVAIAIIILVFAIVIGWVTSGDTATHQASRLKGGLDEIGKFFGGGGGHGGH